MFLDPYVAFELEVVCPLCHYDWAGVWYDDNVPSKVSFECLYCYRIVESGCRTLRCQREDGGWSLASRWRRQELRLQPRKANGRQIWKKCSRCRVKRTRFYCNSCIVGPPMCLPCFAEHNRELEQNLRSHKCYNGVLGRVSVDLCKVGAIYTPPPSPH